MLLENVKIRVKNGKNVGLKLTRVGLPALVLVLAAIVYLTINLWSDFSSTTREPRLTDQPSIFVSELKTSQEIANTITLVTALQMQLLQPSLIILIKMYNL